MSDKASKDKEEEGSSGNTDVSSSQQTSASGDEDKTAEEEAGASAMDRLQQFMARALSLGVGARKTEEVAQVLDEVSFEGVARFIKSGKCKNIITMVGAGISTSAGIPDFRSPGTGLYDNLQQYDLPHPQAIFMIDFFKENPKPFFVLAKELYPGSFKPTVCHYFIRMLHEKGLLRRHYTQNIDTLERVAGLPQEKLVEAHGTFHTSHCLECGAEYSLPWMKEKIFADEIPMCAEKDCEGVVKPDIVFFGESLPQRFAECASEDLKKCDLLIVMGTSLVVQPFASLASRVPSSTPRLYINLEKTTSEDDFMALLMGGAGGGFRFDAEDNVRDVFKQATCDDGCTLLAQHLGWAEELGEVVKSEHERIDQENSTQGEAAASSAEKSSTDNSASSKGAENSPTSKSPEQKL